ncbi:YvrJ family protein [Bacillus salitolerans]|uniref:YvrJ family protein n=1 Tax=Bacillus salitolerans TaxID=1437434 RepID=A0ABW4LUK8_9BACI
MEEANFWIDNISNLGFHIVITLFLLVRLERKLEMLRNSIVELNKNISNSKGGF